MSLIHDAQELAIIQANDTLHMSAFREAYNRRHKQVHGMIKNKPIRLPPVKNDVETYAKPLSNAPEKTISEIAGTAKTAGENIVEALRKNGINITEVSLC